jgi:superfamily II DNA/RNA helicase
MDVFNLRESVVNEYREYVESFIRVHDTRIADFISKSLHAGQLWPDAVLQLNPAFEMDETVGELAKGGLLAPETARFFGESIRLYRHQRQALDVARGGEPYVVTTGTGSGKSLTYLIPVYDWIVRHKPAEHTVRAIIVYPMNALINSQLNALEKYRGQFPGSPVRFAKFTGQEKDEEKQAIRDDPPHVLLTNYVMLEYILMRPSERSFLRTATADLKFLVMDELHFYRGRQGADVAMLLRRLQQKAGHVPLVIGTSATMASEGDRAERNRTVADVATKLFGVHIKPDNIIDETLKRVAKVAVPEAKDDLCKAAELPPPQATLDAVTNHPLAAWTEETFGLTHDKEGRLIRRPPMTFEAAVAKLAECSGLSREKCETSLRSVLEAGNAVEVFPDQPVFAFRLHQFVSSGSSVYATLAASDKGLLTMDGQYKAESGEVLYPLAFCRDCGQEYALVTLIAEGDSSRMIPRPPLGGQDDDMGGRVGYFAIENDSLWEGNDEDLPEFWFAKKKKGWEIKPEYAEDRPVAYWAQSDGILSASERAGSVKGWFQRYPLMLCPRCLAAYDRRDGEFRKLSSLSQIGRSTATTVMVNAAVAGMKDQKVRQEESKVLSFTDNRQDASLQAGHLNDFVQVALLRAGLCEALKKHGSLTFDQLGDSIFEAMNPSPQDFLRQPVDSGPGYEQGRLAMIDLLQYRTLEDLTRGWRVTQPNMEQAGLLKIEYYGLADLAKNDKLWQALPPIDQATPEKRAEVLGHFLDELRMNLAIEVDALKETQTRRLVDRTSQWLCDPWALQKNDLLKTQGIMLLPEAVEDQDEKRARVRQLNFRSTIGRYLRQPRTWGINERLTVEEVETLVTGIVDRLAGQLLLKVTKRNKDHGVRLLAAALRWTKGDGKPVGPSPLRGRQMQRRRNLKESQPNSYFNALYTRSATRLRGMVAHEHTGQIDAQTRIDREIDFGTGKLPALFCSPTMELGVDIRELYAVHLRNVPPTPANYAQRSGRAGRGGKPALIATFAGQGNAHDQYFFRNRTRMISGVVEPSKMDLRNKELVEAHIHSVWLATVGLGLSRSMNDILDLNANGYPLKAEIQADLDSRKDKIEKETLAAAKELIEKEPPLKDAWWYSEDWLSSLVKQAAAEFDASFARWRELYAAANTVIAQARTAGDSPAATRAEKETAARVEAEAKRERSLLLNDTRRMEESDFYPYRYLAAEGFIPGYNFPRLPVRAFVTVGDSSHTIDRPRFLAITEFGPGNALYHEGRKYRIDGVVLPAAGIGDRLVKARICRACGYIHDDVKAGVDVCEHCGTGLDASTSDYPQRLLEQPPVLTRSVERILSDEEERIRSGYRVTTQFRFEPGAKVERSVVKHGDNVLLEMTYVPAAQIWRINQGWRRSTDAGFAIDPQTGRWRRDSDVVPDADNPNAAEVVRGVMPFVKDNRNVLLIRPVTQQKPTREFMTTLQHALKRGIEFVFQVEDQEISAELIGQGENWRIILWEAAEGGTGISELLTQGDDAMARVAQKALELCHFGPPPTEGAQASPPCSAACYECLLSYANQNEHRFIDRYVIKDFLTELALSKTERTTKERSRQEQYEWLKTKTDPGSTLETAFLDYLYSNGHNLPSTAQFQPSNEVYVQADFYYDRGNIPGVCIFVDGPSHDPADAQQRDQGTRMALEDNGFRVVVIRYDSDFETQVKAHPDVFGKSTM